MFYKELMMNNKSIHSFARMYGNEVWDRNLQVYQTQQMQRSQRCNESKNLSRI